MINVEAILEDVIETLSILAVDTELIFFVNHDVPASLVGDSGKLRQIIMNLVGTRWGREKKKKERGKMVLNSM